jgi:hypothetical protein
LNEKVAAAVKKTVSLTTRQPLTSPTSGGRSVGIVRLRTKGHGVSWLVSKGYNNEVFTTGYATGLTAPN